MSRIDITRARVYVGTDYKCSQENYEGKWLYLVNYKSHEEFSQACKEIHSNENNPKFLYFDYEDLPYVYINQYWIEPRIFDLIQIVIAQDNLLHSPISAWIDYLKPNIGEDNPNQMIETFKIHFEGPFENEIKYAIYYAQEYLNINPKDNPSFHFKSFADFLFKTKFVILDGYVFKKITF